MGTDKYDLGYVPTYEQIAAELGEKAHILEVGVYHGESLKLWRELFPAGLIVGVDNNPGAIWPEDTVRIVADQSDPSLRIDLEPLAPFDLVVEDASHDGNLSRATLDIVWPLVRPGGYYVIEDWQVGFPSWAGHDDSMLRMAEGLLAKLEHPTDLEITYRHGQIILRHRPSA